MVIQDEFFKGVEIRNYKIYRKIFKGPKGRFDQT